MHNLTDMKSERLGPHEVMETDTTFSFRMAPVQWWFFVFLLILMAAVGGVMAYTMMFISKEPLQGNKRILVPALLVLSPILMVFAVWFTAQGNEWTVIDRSANEYRKKSKVFSTVDSLKFAAIENLNQRSWLVGLSDGTSLVGNKLGFRSETEATAFKNRVDSFLSMGRS